MNKIKIKFPDGNVREFEKGITPFQVAQSISERLADDVLAAKVNGSVIDMQRPIYQDTDIHFLKFDDEEGKEVYWHSSSHLMAHAIKSLYPEAKFGVGPAIENGFYYDFDINKKLDEEDLRKIEQKMESITKQDHKFERTELPKAKAIDFFKKQDDQYKLEILSELDENNEIISIYNEGDFTDLCTGPHLPSAGKIKFVKLLSVSGSYWRGDEHNKQMQRIYGISFPKKKMLDDYIHFLEEAKRRDHRKLGKQLDLFSVHEEAGAGLIYWHPKGARIRMEIENYWRDAHLKNGYELLYSPHMGKSWLWETSGHLDFYKDSMYSGMKIDEQDYYIKPMNCPFHIMIYKSHLRSYRDLPLRWAELGTVYRYEKSGVLHGLLRVRGFTQDDAHIFCAHEQIESEIQRTVNFARMILGIFGFIEMNFYLATKPEEAVGEVELWDKAVESLRKALEAEKLNYQMDEGGGAFYGPKIDIKIKDALGREWQLSTIQFDFNLPERFDIKYIGEDGKEHRPFMVHRALLGSIERFFGILIEHYGGDFPLWLAPVQAVVIPVSQNFFEYANTVNEKLIEHFAGDFPLWLAPVQAVVIPVSQNFFEYANTVNEKLIDAGIRTQIDERNEKIGYKIRDWETQKVPYMIIVGEKEQNAANISVRQHKKGDLGAFTLSDFIDKLANEIKNKDYTTN